MLLCGAADIAFVLPNVAAINSTSTSTCPYDETDARAIHFFHRDTRDGTFLTAKFACRALSKQRDTILRIHAIKLALLSASNAISRASLVALIATCDINFMRDRERAGLHACVFARIL